MPAEGALVPVAVVAVNAYHNFALGVDALRHRVDAIFEQGNVLVDYFVNRAISGIDRANADVRDDVFLIMGPNQLDRRGRHT